MDRMGVYRITIFTILFIAVTAGVFYPLITNIGTSINGFPDDAYAIIWHLWWFKYSIMDLKTLPTFTSFVESPFGVEVSQTTIANHLIALPFTYLWGPITSYNIMILLSFVLSSLGMYLLVFELTSNNLASVFAGLAYAFSPYHIVFSASGGMDAAQIQYMPFVILFLLRYERTKTLSDLIGFFIFLFFSLLSFGYYAVLTVFIIFLYLLYMKFIPFVIRSTSKETLGLSSIKRQVVELYPEPLRIFFVTVFFYVLVNLSLGSAGLFLDRTITIGSVLLFAGVIFFQDIKGVLRWLLEEMAERYRRYNSIHRAFIIFYMVSLPLVVMIFLVPVFSDSSRNISSSYIAPLFSYLVPPPDHPLLGQLIPDYLVPSPDPLMGKIVYTGITVSVLSILAITGRKRKNPLRQFFIIVLLSGILLSLPPVIRIGVFTFNTPVYYFHILVPPFVDIRRMVILILLASTVLAGLGLKEVISRFNHRFTQVMAVAPFVLLAGVEFFPGITIRNMTDTPEAYRWLAEREGDFTVVEYPLTSIHDVRRYEPFYGQTIHGKRLMNPFGVSGHDPLPRNPYLREIMGKGGAVNVVLSNPRNASIVLSHLGTKYLIVRRDKLGMSKVPDMDGRGFTRIARFMDAEVYRVSPSDADVCITSFEDFLRTGYFLNRDDTNNAHSSTYIKPDPVWQDGKVWLWMGKKGSLKIKTLNEKEGIYDLHFTARSSGSPTRLRITVDGEPWSEVTIDQQPADYIITGIPVRPAPGGLIVEVEVLDKGVLRRAEGFVESDEVQIGAGLADVFLVRNGEMAP